MEPEVWIPIAIALAGFLLALHQMLRRQRRELLADLDEKVEVCVTKKLGPVVRDLERVSAKLNNGLLEASKEHTQKINAVQVEVAAVSVQLANVNKTLERLVEKG